MPSFLAGRGSRGGLVQLQPVALRVVAEQVAIAAPIEGGVDLALDVLAGEVLVQDVAKEFQRHGVVGFVGERDVDLLQKRDAGQGSVPEQNFARGDVAFGELLAGGSDFEITFVELGETKQSSSLDDR